MAKDGQRQDSEEPDSVARSDTASLARSTRDSIISFYGRDSFIQKLLQPQEEEQELTETNNLLAKTPFDEQRFSTMIEDYLLDLPQDDQTWAHTPSSTVVSPLIHQTSRSEGRLEVENLFPRGLDSSPVGSPLRFPSRAKALRTRRVQKLRTEELDIELGEIFHVSATNSKYWMAINAQGRTGLIRARYLVLQDDDSSSEDEGQNRELLLPSDQTNPFLLSKKTIPESNDLRSPSRLRELSSPKASITKKRPQPLILAHKSKAEGFEMNTSSSPPFLMPQPTLENSMDKLSSGDKIDGSGAGPSKYEPSKNLLRAMASAAQSSSANYVKRSPTETLGPPRSAPLASPSYKRDLFLEKSLPQLPNSAQVVDKQGASKEQGSSPRFVKSLHMTPEDETFSVLPAFLRKYKLQAHWSEYSLWIVRGDEKRCLGLREKPLQIFNSLRDLPGDSPVFALIKNAPLSEGD